LPLELQVKLLRVLQEGAFERLGSSRTIQVDVRVIAATNRDLKKAMASGDFREDLYYRLHVFPLTLPPLRERPEDIPLLVQHFVAMYSAKLGKTIETIPPRVMAALQAYSWPGNVHELEHLVERAVISTLPSLSRKALE
jgi:transcriptional regulator with GAF, ATPase, and Fis domain